MAHYPDWDIPVERAGRQSSRVWTGDDARKYALESCSRWWQFDRMFVIERTIRVNFQHRVYFTRGVFAPANPLLREVLIHDEREATHKALVVLDDSLALARPDLARDIETYFSAMPGRLQLVCAPMLMEGGERVKNSCFHVSEVQSPIDRYHIDRHSYVIAVGGGALLDMVGLAAATAHRGCRLVRIPTTTLSQSDSGVGIKNGINAFGKKNFIGTFTPPFAVINDFDLLASLSERDTRAGLVEAVKVALIRDRSFFDMLDREAERLGRFDAGVMEPVIRRCAELHVDHIAGSGDPFECGSARPLDFGHWSAHKLEQLSNYEIRHGEAVAVGIALDIVYSRRMAWLDTASAERALDLLERLGFDLFANELLNADSDNNLMVLKGLEEFREHLGGRLTITLLNAIGHAFEVHEMNLPRVIESIYELQERHNARAKRVVAAQR